MDLICLWATFDKCVKHCAKSEDRHVQAAKLSSCNLGSPPASIFRAKPMIPSSLASKVPADRESAYAPLALDGLATPYAVAHVYIRQVKLNQADLRLQADLRFSTMSATTVNCRSSSPKPCFTSSSSRRGRAPPISARASLAEKEKWDCSSHFQKQR